MKNYSAQKPRSMSVTIKLDDADRERIALAAGETAHAHRATPFGDLELLGLQVIGGENGGFAE